MLALENRRLQLTSRIDHRRQQLIQQHAAIRDRVQDLRLLRLVLGSAGRLRRLWILATGP